MAVSPLLAMAARPLGIMLLLAVLSPGIASAHPLQGRVWEPATGGYLEAEAVFERAAATPLVLLGERHDSDEHHRLQLAMLEAMTARGRRPALAMEQFDGERQPALDRSRDGGVTDAEAIADAGALNRKSWRWPMYKSLIGHAARQGWPLVAANLSRAEAREIVLGKRRFALPEAAAGQIAAMEGDIVHGHCGQHPGAERLAGLVAAQRARDLTMARALDSVEGDGGVLIAGAGHVRRDRAVPRYLKRPEDALAIAYVEVEPGKTSPSDYDAAGFDLLWFTPPTPRPDPCARALSGTVSAPAGLR